MPLKKVTGVRQLRAPERVDRIRGIKFPKLEAPRFERPIIHRRGPKVADFSVNELEKRAVPKAFVYGTLPERILYKALEYRRIPFDFQSSFFGGRMELNGMVADFVLLDRPLIIQVQGEYWHSQLAAKIKDQATKGILESLGYQVEEIWEHEIYDINIFEEWLEDHLTYRPTVGGGIVGGAGVMATNAELEQADKLLQDRLFLAEQQIEHINSTLFFGASPDPSWQISTPNIRADSITADKIFVNALSAITANMGTLTAGTIMVGGATAYGTGTGIWLGSDSGIYKFRAGNPSGNRITWDGSVLTVVGALTATSGAIGGWKINATSIYTGTEDHDGYTANAGDITIYSSGTVASIHAKKFYIDTSGNLTATGVTLTGAITATSGAIGGWTINATSIYTGTEDHDGYTANAGDITIYSDGSDASIHAKNFYIDTAGSITATSVNLTGAITATSGAVGGWTINTTNLTNGSLVIDSSIPAIRMGATAYGTGTGVFLGNDGGTYKFRIGDPAGTRLTWDGTDLGLYQASLTFNYATSWGAPEAVWMTGDANTTGYIDCAYIIGVPGIRLGMYTTSGISSYLSFTHFLSGGATDESYINLTSGEEWLIAYYNEADATAGQLILGDVLTCRPSSMRVGINDSAPDYPLEVTGTAEMDGFLMSTSAVSGKVLTADSTGLGTWQVSPIVPNLFKPLREEFLHSDHTEDFYRISINSGTTAAYTGTANHPGCCSLRGTTSANSGFAFMTSIVSMLLAGGEEFEICFRTTDASSENRARFGWSAASDATAAPKGAYLRINGLTIDGQCTNAAGTTNTGTTYTYSAGTWYRAKIVVNSDATLVTFTLYSEAGASLWSQTINANIPVAAGDEVGAGAVWYQTSTTQRICTLDWMVARIDRTLTR